MKIKDKFTLSENPRNEGGDIFIIHHLNPIAHMRVWHEAITMDAATNCEIFNYKNSEGEIETITFEITHCFFEGKIKGDDETAAAVRKLFNDARHWYCSYMDWEDQQIESND